MLSHLKLSRSHGLSLDLYLSLFWSLIFHNQPNTLQLAHLVLEMLRPKSCNRAIWKWQLIPCIFSLIPMISSLMCINRHLKHIVTRGKTLWFHFFFLYTTLLGIFLGLREENSSLYSVLGFEIVLMVLYHFHSSENRCFSFVCEHLASTSLSRPMYIRCSLLFSLLLLLTDCFTRVDFLQWVVRWELRCKTNARKLHQNPFLF